MGDEIMNFQPSLVDATLWNQEKKTPPGSLNAIATLATTEDFNEVVAAIRAAKQGDGGGAYDKEISRLKHMVRNNHWPVHHEIRATLWQTLCNIRANVEKEPYHALCEDIFGPSSNRRKDVELPAFVNPQFVLNYHLNAEGIAAAKRIVCTIAHNHPEITWAPRMYPTTALLLHYMSESSAYDAMCALYRSNKEFTQFSETKNSYKASKLVLKDLTKKYAKNVYRFFLRYSAPDQPDALFDRWVWWLFDCFPFHAVVRMVDCYLVEGSKVLYRVAIAVILEFYKYADLITPGCYPRQFDFYVTLRSARFWLPWSGRSSNEKTSVNKTTLGAEMNNENEILNDSEGDSADARCFCRARPSLALCLCRLKRVSVSSNPFPFPRSKNWILFRSRRSFKIETASDDAFRGAGAGKLDRETCFENPNRRLLNPTSDGGESRARTPIFIYPCDPEVGVSDKRFGRGKTIVVWGGTPPIVGRNSENLMTTSCPSRAIEAFCSSGDIDFGRVFRKAFKLRGFSRKEINSLLNKNEKKIQDLPSTLSMLDMAWMTTVNPGCKSLTDEQWRLLFSWVPPSIHRRTHYVVMNESRDSMGQMIRFTVNDSILLFTTDRDGISLRTLYQKVEDYEPLLLLVSPMETEDGRDVVFGAYLSQNLANRHNRHNRGFFGNGESFLFSFSPEPRKYEWVGTRRGAEISVESSLFLAADDTSLIIGGGGSGEGLSIDEELNRGRTQTCKTFNNPPLISGGDFTCRLVEVVGFGTRPSPG